MSDHLQLEGPHWTFALRLYGSEGVADACLTLQDRLGVDVNVLLFALYAALERGTALNERDLRDIEEAVGDWRREVILPLRSVRRRMKSGPAPAPSKATEALRSMIKKAELRAEQIEQTMLARWLDRRDRREASGDIDAAELLQRIATFFAVSGGIDEEIVQSPDIRAALAALAHSANALGSAQQT